MKHNNTTGFPSPAQGYEEETFDYNKLLVKHPASTFAMKYAGKNMNDESIKNGDILIVDSSIYPRPESVAVVETDGEFKLIKISKNDGYTSITKVWGIVTSIVRLL
ncbi:MAG: S24 family peptidase [Treponema sp.]